MTDTDAHTAYVLVGTNSGKPREPSLGAVILSEQVARTAIDELDADGPYDEDNPYWEADDDAPWRRWRFTYPRDEYHIEPRPLHRE